jgi:DegV family protein with EDD domain
LWKSWRGDHSAARLANEGATKEVLLNHIEFLSNHMEHIITVDDLQYFVRGGRVSKFQGFIGGLLNIKPILHLKDGVLTPFEKLRGSKKTFERILSIIEERGDDLKNQTIGIAHADNFQTANLLKEEIIKRFGCDKFIINSIGAAIGAHAGPGAYGVFFLNKKR